MRTIRLFPSGHHYARALADAGLDREVVGQPARAAQAGAQPAAGREAVLEGPLDVGDPGPLVLEGHAQPAPGAVDERLHPGRTASAVVDGVPGELARRRDHLGLVDEAQP